MAYRVTKTHVGWTWDASYPDPVPQNLSEFNTIFDAKSVSTIISEIAALNLTGWSTHASAITTVLNASVVSETFDKDTQTLTVVKDWPSKALHDQWTLFVAQIDWATTIPLVDTTSVSGAEV